MMQFSKRIADYFEIKLTDLKPGTELPFDLYLIFHKSNHILLWKRKSEFITDGFLDRYQERGMHSIWLSVNDKKAFENYLNPSPQEEATPKVQPKEEPIRTLPEKPLAPPKTEEGKKILEAMKAPDLSEEKKKEIVGKESKTLVQTLATQNTKEAQEKAQEKAREIVQDVLNSVLDESESLISEIWNLANVDPELTHGLNVSTYAVIFSLAFGKLDQQLLSDLALAGLLHDVGVSGIHSNICTTPWTQFNQASLQHYAQHVTLSQQLLTEFESSVSPRVLAMIKQHHEKFDGSGYPSGLKGFQLDEISQLLGMAEILDSISCGQWDGTERPLSETLMILEKFEKNRTFPEYFNPELFESVMKWTKDPEFKSASSDAIKVVEKQTKQVIQAA